MTVTVGRATYQTTSSRGLRFDSVPMKLFQKAKKLGIWDPADLDFSQDRADWAAFTDIERDWILRLLALFQAGEEAVTVDLLPLIHAVASDGHIEEEIYLTSFLWEEAKHVEFFRRWLNEVAEVDYDLHRYVTPSYRQLFFEELPRSMNALLTDTSREAQARASVTYNMVIEGMLAETGYHGFRRALKQNGKCPGICAGVELTARDESRHIRYGVYLLERLVSEDDSLWEVVKGRMNEIFPMALAVTPEFWDEYEAPYPFGLTMDEFVDFAAQKFDARMRVLERDRGKSMAEIETAVTADLEADERELAEAFG
ncbi:MAG: ribonucleoside-diphosphate reductase beta chain [Chloroflexota bacterium]|jgi:ribonucleoside-diphosphate reductase beta chain|nr:ribonucleoside-diphosphate reductase beta chain [Chloroflexota bacterium]